MTESPSTAPSTDELAAEDDAQESLAGQAVVESTGDVDEVEADDTADDVDDDESDDDESDDGESDDGESDGGESDDTESDDTEDADERLVREGDVAADYLEKLLDVADLDGDIDVDIDGDRAAVAIVDSEEGRVPRRLVGRDGEVLEALQELTRLAVLAQTGERSRLMLDVAGHRAGRRQALVAQAEEAVSTVRSSGERLELPAMSPFERKVVHDAVAALGLATESEGVEPNRHVVVLPA